MTLDEENLLNSPHAGTALVVSARPRNLEQLGGLLRERGLDVVAVTSLGEMDEHLLRADRFDLALVDRSDMGPGLWSRCESLAEAAVPFVLIVSLLSPSVRNAGLSAGARAVLAKPLGPGELGAFVDNVLQTED